jgi:hypothetical protein
MEFKKFVCRFLPRSLLCSGTKTLQLIITDEQA